MSEHKEHNKNWLRNILDYLSDKMTGRERNSFEKSLERDAFEADAFEGLSSLSEDELSKDLALLKTKLYKRTKKRSGIPFLRIAAGFAVIAVMSLSYFLIFDKQMKKTQEYTLGESLVEKQEGISEDSILPKNAVEDDLSEVKPSKEKSTSPIETAEKKQEETKTVLHIVEDDMEIPEIDFETEKKETIAFSETEMAERVIEMNDEEVVEIPAAIADNARSKSAAPAGISIISAKKMASDEKPLVLQGMVISGEDSLPIPGATIKLRGVASRTITDNEGYFVVEAKEDSETVVIASMLGMKTEEVTMDKSGIAEIVMEPDELSLDEVVVVGYGRNPDSRAVEDLEKDEPVIESNYSPAIPLGGYASFREYIEKNLVFPDNIRDNDRAVVIIKTIINEKGFPTKIEIIKSPDEAFSKEAKRLLLEGPPWLPAERAGEYLGENTRIRIVFKR